jgi:peptide-methionine (R)-S-oxide reductase
MFNQRNQRTFVTFVLLLAVVLTSCTTANQNKPTPNSMENQSATNKGEKLVKTEEEWKNELTPMQYYVLRQKGTERAFTGAYWNTKDVGQYLCAGCKTLLFTSKTKYDSGCGWPSFFEAHNNDNIEMRPDNSHGMSRVEIVCATCDGHLGHIFEDGPPPTGVRYCVNSESMIFIPAEDEK